MVTALAGNMLDLTEDASNEEMERLKATDAELKPDKAALKQRQREEGQRLQREKQAAFDAARNPPPRPPFLRPPSPLLGRR